MVGGVLSRHRDLSSLAVINVWPTVNMPSKELLETKTIVAVKPSTLSIYSFKR